MEDVEGAVEVHALGPGKSLLVLLTVPVKHLQLHGHAVIVIVLPAAGGTKERRISHRVSCQGSTKTSNKTSLME